MTLLVGVRAAVLVVLFMQTFRNIFGIVWLSKCSRKQLTSVLNGSAKLESARSYYKSDLLKPVELTTHDVIIFQKWTSHCPGVKLFCGHISILTIF